MKTRNQNNKKHCQLESYKTCEYLKVPLAEKRRTDVLRLRKKKEERDNTATQMASGDALLCPVRQWAKVVRRIWGYNGAAELATVPAICRSDTMEHISSKEMVNMLRAAVFAFGKDKLGIKMEDIGTHSIQSGAAMSMYLGECP
eukprot:2900436-Ditylum_brightwellii.AAC.1